MKKPHIRVVEYAKEFLSSVYLRGYNKKNVEKSSAGVAGLLCWVARIVGSVGVVLSLGFLATPWLWGWSWLEALFWTAGGILLSRQLMDFHISLHKAMATWLMVWSKLQNKSWEETIYGQRPDSAAAPSS